MPIYAEVFEGEARPSVTGYVIREPEKKQVGKLNLLSFAISSASKAQEYQVGKIDRFGETITADKVGQYITDTIVNVDLKFDMAKEFADKINKGDRVKVVGTLSERAYNGKNGIAHSLEFSFINSVEVISKGNNSQQSAPLVTDTAPEGSSNWGSDKASSVEGW